MMICGTVLMSVFAWLGFITASLLVAFAGYKLGEVLSDITEFIKELLSAVRGTKRYKLSKDGCRVHTIQEALIKTRSYHDSNFDLFNDCLNLLEERIAKLEHPKKKTKRRKR